MHCEHYGKYVEKGYCPFAYNCTDDCIFSYKYKSEQVEELYAENKALQEELWDANTDFSPEIENLENEVEYWVDKYKRAIELCKFLVSHREATEKELKDNIYLNDELEYNDIEELVNLLEERVTNSDQ